MIKETILEHLKVSKSLIDEIDNIEKILKISLNTIKSGNKIILCGNGGSATDASHIAAEFVGKFERDKYPLPAISLSDNMSTITAVGNDYGFEEIFSRQIKAIGKKNDLLIAISTSGNSKNILEAIKVANELEIKCFAFSGKDGGKILDLKCDIIRVNSTNTARIQEMHILIGHLLCKFIDENI
tara:strand:+ start:325 stop:876 length:552 start_codon:yes stop_codon:yes gene_type:complete